jgi:hypothetical protein
VISGVLLIAGGCGGGLSYKMDDGALDAVPATERQGVFDARRDVEVAQGEKRTAENQLESLSRDTDIADKERQQAKLEVEKVGAELESAIQSHDENRHNSANHAKEVAELGLKAAEAKMDWLSQRKDWLKQTRSTAQAHIDAAEARVEFEKAKVAKQKGLKPSDDFDAAKFESQWRDKNAEYESSKKDVQSEERKTKELETKWQDLVNQQSKAKGTG